MRTNLLNSAPLRYMAGVSLVAILLPSLAQDTRAAERELIRDAKFEHGLRLYKPEPGKRVLYGQLPGVAQGSQPVWDVAQWSSKFPLAVGPAYEQGDGARRFANEAKALTLGPSQGPERADLSLAVSGPAEYGGLARKPGGPWVHLLVSQRFEQPPCVTDLEAAHVHLAVRLRRSRLVRTDEYSPRIHAAQFLMFLTIQNLNRQSPGFGDYLWFGIPLYDDRYRIPRAHTQPDAAGKFIFSPEGTAYTDESAHDGTWITISRDVLPLIHEGLKTAWGRGSLRESQSSADYRIAGMNLGWEVPGIFDVEAQVRDLSLKVSGPSME